ncbi:hypothetical protein N0V90_003654 [Kalmusia sp. IMI 367209]|nr:hypothetical protein N0V90_003654 [Kalmusia sp. IMI 367209]
MSQGFPGTVGENEISKWLAGVSLTREAADGIEMPPHSHASLSSSHLIESPRGRYERRPAIPSTAMGVPSTPSRFLQAGAYAARDVTLNSAPQSRSRGPWAATSFMTHTTQQRSVPVFPQPPLQPEFPMHHPRPELVLRVPQPPLQPEFHTYRPRLEMEYSAPPPPYTPFDTDEVRPQHIFTWSNTSNTTHTPLIHHARNSSPNATRHQESTWMGGRNEGIRGRETSAKQRPTGRLGVIGSRIEKSVKNVKKKAAELPKAAQRLHNGWQSTRAKSKLDWLHKKGYLNDQERMQVDDDMEL